MEIECNARSGRLLKERSDSREETAVPVNKLDTQGESLSIIWECFWLQVIEK
jgi:hypothetical protein